MHVAHKIESKLCQKGDLSFGGDGISIVTGAIVQAIVSIGVFGLLHFLAWGIYLDSDLSANSYISMIVACFALSWIMSE